MRRPPSRLFANEARRCIRIAGARVARPFRIGAGGALHDDGLRGVVTLKFRGDQLLWRGSGLDPLGQGREDVMVRIDHVRRQSMFAADRVWPFASSSIARRTTVGNGPEAALRR